MLDLTNLNAFNSIEHSVFLVLRELLQMRDEIVIVVCDLEDEGSDIAIASKNTSNTVLRCICVTNCVVKARNCMV